MTWYEKMPGVLRITNSQSAKTIMQFINNYKYDEHKIFAYLMAFIENSFKCYQYDGMKERMNITEEECVNNMAKAILNTIDDYQGSSNRYCS